MQVPSAQFLLLSKLSLFVSFMHVMLQAHLSKAGPCQGTSLHIYAVA